VPIAHGISNGPLQYQVKCLFVDVWRIPRGNKAPGLLLQGLAPWFFVIGYHYLHD
jgi:hypothetical protein